MQGYYQIRIKAKDRLKTIFKAPNDLYKFKVLPFELANVLAVFQMSINKIFRQQIKKLFLAYLGKYLCI